MILKVRALSRADIDSIQHIGKAAYVPYYKHLWHEGGLEWYMEYCFNNARLEKEMEDENIAYFIAEYNKDTPIGFMKVYWNKALPTAPNSHATLLEKIYLLPKYKGQGKGRFLIAWLEGKAKQKGADWLWLDVMKSGPKKAYERAGFEVISDKKIPFEKMKIEERALWVMAKKLTN